MMTTYQIKSVKHSEEFTGELADAIARAIEINAEYQPSFGVQVEDEDGETLWDSEYIDDDLRNEIGEAVEAADVCAPEQVVDMCCIAVREGRDWREELQRAKEEDLSCRKSMGLVEYRFENGSLYILDYDKNAYVHCFSSPYATNKRDAIAMYEESQERN